MFKHYNGKINSSFWCTSRKWRTILDEIVQNVREGLTGYMGLPEEIERGGRTGALNKVRHILPQWLYFCTGLRLQYHHDDESGIHCEKGGKTAQGLYKNLRNVAGCSWKKVFANLCKDICAEHIGHGIGGNVAGNFLKLGYVGEGFLHSFSHPWTEESLYKSHSSV